MPGAVIDVIIRWAETKILKEKMKWTVRVWKVFTLSKIARLHTVIKIKHSQHSCSIYIVSYLKKWVETLHYVSCFSLHFFRALAASCVLYNRTERSIYSFWKVMLLFLKVPFSQQKKNKPKLNISFYLSKNRRYFFILIIWFYQLSW